MRTPSFHVPFIKASLPGWIKHLAAPDIAALNRSRDPLQRFKASYPQVFAAASAPQRQALFDSGARRQASNEALATTLKDFKGIAEFAEPLLTEALRKKFALAPDVNKTTLYHLRAPNRLEEQSLLQAALRNFEADEPFDEVALQETSALAPAGSLETHLYDEQDRYPFAKVRYSLRDKLPIKPADFASLCRELDLGKQYQDHLAAVFEAPATAAQVRRQSIEANKDSLRVQAQIARMRSTLSEEAYTILMRALDGVPSPEGCELVYSQLNVLGSHISDVVIISAQTRRLAPGLEQALDLFMPQGAGRALLTRGSVIVFIPGDLHAPVAEYPSLNAFATQLAVDLRSLSYQRFFAGFLPKDESATFFRRLKSQLKTYRWNPNPKPPSRNYNPSAYAGGLYEEVWNDEVNLHVKETFIAGEVFGQLYEAHLARLKYNARLLAVPTAEVDHKAWIERLKHWAEWGLNVLNIAAFFVPGLGEVMMAVAALQIGYEVYQGVNAWNVGDADEAWAHLTSVMQNVAFMAALGAVASKAPPILPSRFVNGMTRVASPFGTLRLWHADLAAYKSNISLTGLKPNTLGQYEVAGKNYISIEGNAYEKTFDPSIKQWRIKHPTEIDAYQPILRHDGLGAWRHTLERPLEWSRKNLLRRMGPRMERFSDVQLEQIADVSGVSDEGLRKLHIDHRVPPPELAEMARLFEVDRQAGELIEQIRQGDCLDGQCQFMVPLAVQMPNWPAEEVLEVFSGAEHWGASQRFGSAQALNSSRPTIKITEAEVNAGNLPERVLAAMDEEQVGTLLGSDALHPGADRVQRFRERLAEHAQSRHKALFDNLLSRQAAPGADTLILQRSFPSLSPEAAQHVLGGASTDELSQLRSSGRVPLRLARESVPYLHRSLLSRALAGLSVENLASAASDRLALHTLEQLPGWSQDIRVEVRAYGLRGPLVDSIGNDDAPIRYYLIKADDSFRAFNAQGGALNSVPRFGRNLYASLVQVLPEAFERTLLGNPGEALQKKVTDFACSHRDDMSLILKHKASVRGGRLMRHASGRLGYPASGDGVGFAEEPLVARVRDIYPNITDQQAAHFIRARLSSGETDQQVFTLLENRRREFEGLRTSLDTWVEGAVGHRGFGWPSRRDVADRVIACWRNGLYREQAPAFGLDLLGADSMPPWAGHFAHVRTLRLTSSLLNDATLRQSFSGLQSLDIYIEQAGMPALAAELPAWNRITELKLERQPLFGAYSPALTEALQGLTQLERLQLTGRQPVLDYSALTRLRHLVLDGPRQEWPNGLLALDGLESADLSRMPIPALPDALFSGHERLWRRLQLNWAALEPQAFIKAFEYVHENPAHLVDEPRMVAQYCRRRLDVLIPQREAFATDALDAFRQEGLEGRALLDRVEALHEEYRAFNAPLLEWQASDGARVEGIQMRASQRQVLADRMRGCWRDALAYRYAPSDAVVGPPLGAGELASETLNLANYGAPGDLPALGTALLPQVRRLVLSGARLTATHLNEFLRAFPQLHELDLGGNRLTELPQSLESLVQLKELNLSGNELTITASTQARLSRLTSVQRLDLSRNRIGSLRVTSLTDLVSLNLSETQVGEWPEGVLSLPRLGFLDLSHSAITTIPEAAWVGHDVMLAGTSLRGCRLSPQAMASAQAFADRTGPGAPLASMFERPLGIDRNVLAAGSTGGDPAFFPIEVSQRPDLLLPLPLGTQDAALTMTSSERLQRLDPQLDTARASHRIDAWLVQGVNAFDIENALNQWTLQHTQLIERLNGWIDVPAVRDNDVWVNATDRRRAADRLLACWRETLRDVHREEGAASDYYVDLSGLILGDLPALPVTLNHVGALNLTGVRLTTGSDGFLRAFPRLNSLMLNANRMGAVPEAVTHCAELTRLGLNDNALAASESLQRQLRALPQLQVLDLGQNNLDTFDITGLERLQSLDLSENDLSDWPTGVLQAPALTTLNLRNNAPIEHIPLDAFAPEHARLMAGTDLSDNLLQEQEFIRLREYQRETGRGLGFTAREIERYLTGYGPESASDQESLAEDDDVHPEIERESVRKARWFDGVAADSEKHRIWDTVMARDNTADFAYILAQLRNTRDFEVDRAGVAARVWEILEAAYADQALSERLMGIAQASRGGNTCGDGWMLLFNTLEIEVYEFNFLRAVDPAAKGRTLLKLSRGLFRLAQVEEVANQRIQLKPRIDPAEIRLAYRIGLSQRLELPRQPRGMLFAGISGVTPADLEVAYTTILAQEQTPVFIEQLIARQYWVDYLQEKYPDAFSTLQQARYEKLDAVDAQYAGQGRVYEEQMLALKVASEADRQALLVELSTREIAALGH